VFTVQKNSGKLQITIGDAWIGYELEIDKSVLGKKIGFSEDMDNYPLQGEYADISLQIYNEALVCLRGLLEEGVYIGIEKSKRILVIPIDDDRYRNQKW
jgi:hypothetical protein